MINLMKKRLTVLFFIVIIILSGCSSFNKNINRIHKWDNSKYKNFPSSIGINVYNENSFNTGIKDDPNSYKANHTLYISDLTKPITVMFNNNGKDRKFIMNVYYDYEQIRFKINSNGKFDQKYIFNLDDGYEIELPLYLPQNLTKSGSHKLLITFCIAPDLHSSDLNQTIDWYGSATIQDIIFSPENINFDSTKEFEVPKNLIKSSYNYTLNQDYDYSILKTKILPNPPVVFTVKPNQKFKLIYNVSSPSAKESSQVLLLTTIGYKQVLINNRPYLLLKLPKGSTGIGEMELTAPDKPGLYEIISYSVCSPFNKFDGKDLLSFNIEASQRFTLKVKE